MTPETVVDLIAAGRFWWHRPGDDTFHATPERVAPESGDVYLLDASDEWLSQFGDNWQGVVDLLAPLMDRLDAPQPQVFMGGMSMSVTEHTEAIANLEEV